MVVDSSTIMTYGNDTVVKLVINQPGTDTPVSGQIVEDALRHSLEDDAASTISNLHLAIVNETIVSKSQRDNAVSVLLQNTMVDEVC